MKENFRIESELQEKPPHSGHRDRFLKKLEGQTASSVVSKKPKYFRLGIAASLAASIALLFMLNPFADKEENRELTGLKSSPKLELAGQANQLEAIYMKHVSPQLIKIKTNLPELDTQIQLLEILESEYAKLKALHITSGGSSLVSQEMIRNHQLRLSLMEEILKHIQLDKTQKSKNHGIESI